VGIDNEGIGRDDLALIQRAVSGDPEARECLALRSRSTVLRWCTSLLRNPDAAEDATQEVLLRMWQHLDALAEAWKFRSWLYCLTLNVVRARSREPNWSALDHDPLSQESSPTTEAIDSARTELAEMFLQLPEAEREILNLRYGLGLSGEEIAEKVGIAQGAARVRLHRALRHLRSLAAKLREGSGNKSGSEGISGDGDGG
jgi:RNA polymerase sigma-70 factor (ECF subfamily)